MLLGPFDRSRFPFSFSDQWSAQLKFLHVCKTYSIVFLSCDPGCVRFSAQFVFVCVDYVCVVQGGPTLYPTTKRVAGLSFRRLPRHLSYCPWVLFFFSFLLFRKGWHQSCSLKHLHHVGKRTTHRHPSRPPPRRPLWNEEMTSFTLPRFLPFSIFHRVFIPPMCACSIPFLWRLHNRHTQHTLEESNDEFQEGNKQSTQKKRLVLRFCFGLFSHCVRSSISWGGVGWRVVDHTYTQTRKHARLLISNIHTSH